MAGDFYDIGYFVETPSGKTRFIKIGSARPRDDGTFWLNFDSLPIPTPDKNGNMRVSAVVQRPKGQYGGGQQQSRPAPDDDSIPF